MKNAVLNERLVIGTAQLGMAYGVANRLGQPSYDDARAIIQEAWSCGIREIDTAQAYGESESILGKIFADLGIAEKVRVISKIDPTCDHRDAKQLKQSVGVSCRRLGIRKLDGVMLHNEANLDIMDSGLSDVLEELTEEGLVERVGVSVYSPHSAVQAIGSDVVDMVQVPANVLDRRFADAGVFKCAEIAGAAVYIRSVFLQGLLLMNPDELPEGMVFAKPIITTFKKLADSLNVKTQQLALGYVKKKYPRANVVIGAETVGQVRDSVTTWQLEVAESMMSRVDEMFVDVDSRVVNPTLWPSC